MKERGAMYDEPFTDAEHATKSDILGRAVARLTHQVAEHGINESTLSMCSLYERLYDKALGPEVVLVEESGVLTVVPA